MPRTVVLAASSAAGTTLLFPGTTSSQFPAASHQQHQEERRAGAVVVAEEHQPVQPVATTHRADLYAISNKKYMNFRGWGEFGVKSIKKYRGMRFHHFLGFLENDGSFFEGVHHHIKKVSQNDGNGPMRPPLLPAATVWL